MYAIRSYYEKPQQRSPERKVSNDFQQTEQAVDMSKITADMLKPLDCWMDILEQFSKVNPAVSGSLKGSQAFVYDNLLLIVAQNQFFINLFKVKENAISLGEVVKSVLGKSYIIRAKCNKK